MVLNKQSLAVRRQVRWLQAASLGGSMGQAVLVGRR
jgi:hypothetical protein